MHPSSPRRVSCGASLKRFALCLARPAEKPPGWAWLHEIKHDGFRIFAERDASGVTLQVRSKRLRLMRASAS